MAHFGWGTCRVGLCSATIVAQTLRITVGPTLSLRATLDDDGSCQFTAVTSLSDKPAGLDPTGLQNDGGPTETILPVLGSPAIGVIPSSPATTLNGVQVCPRTDQRGVESFGNCTIGAVEGAFLITTTSLPNATPGSAYSPVSLTVQGQGQRESVLSRP